MSSCGDAKVLIVPVRQTYRTIPEKKKHASRLGGARTPAKVGQVNRYIDASHYMLQRVVNFYVQSSLLSALAELANQSKVLLSSGIELWIARRKVSLSDRLASRLVLGADMVHRKDPSDIA